MSGIRRETPPADLGITPDHPAYAGHFPGNPVLPGVVLLDAALRRLAAAGWIDPAACDIPWFKFTAPVRPPDRVALEVEEDTEGAMRLRIACGERIVATGVARERDSAR
ncbi:MAG TPA: hypothetical protein VMU86_02680 [Steroidobacteraceae bacterium]|nr:hypothetical protein [Steroidobacteraceae bacterium]